MTLINDLRLHSDRLQAAYLGACFVLINHKNQSIKGEINVE